MVKALLPADCRHDQTTVENRTRCKQAKGLLFTLSIILLAFVVYAIY